MDPHTGRVLAMVGGLGQSQFNRVTQAKRQPGSAFKPFVYLSAMENGYNPTTIVIDGPVEISQGPGLPMWKPKNYQGDFLGPTTLRRGVEKSRNAMTVRLSQMLGINNVAEIAKRFGINENPARNFSMVLGSAETTLIDITNAYAMLVNGGERITPHLIERIQDRNGKNVYKRDNRLCEACAITADVQWSTTTPPIVPTPSNPVTDARSAYQMVSILQGVVERGTAAAARKLGHHLGGKTGTTNDSNDAWFIGFSRDLVVGTYVGYDTPRSLGRRETGASVSLPIFIDFMGNALKNKPDSPFIAPEGIELVKIDALTGKPAAPDATGKGIIIEAFKRGTEPPKSDIPKEPEKPKDPAAHSPLPPNLNMPIDQPTGTGGVY
jgi:penicillin-binding protein 1A